MEQQRLPRNWRRSQLPGTRRGHRYDRSQARQQGKTRNQQLPSHLILFLFLIAVSCSGRFGNRSRFAIR